MTDDLRLPKYDDIEEALELAHAPGDAAETHGLLCGIICSGHRINQQFWLQPIMSELQSEDAQSQKARVTLEHLHKATSEQLANGDFHFEIALPEDETSLILRAEALTHWCQGFLSALRLGGIEMDRKEYSDDVRDIISRFFDIATYDFDAIDINEEDERAFVEVLEFMRVAVLLLQAELNPTANQQKPHIHQTPETVH